MKHTVGGKRWAWQVILGLGTLFFSFSVQAANLDNVLRLSEKGRYQEALQQLENLLKQSPSDAQLRFQKGVLLIQLKKRDEAIAFFEAMVKDFPELPEPYNNLAVLHAEAREFDKAEDALKRAIQTHPTYATAHENLGDIFAKKASLAYNQALQLDQTNSLAQAKLAMVTKLITLPASANPMQVAAVETPAPPKPEPQTRPEPVVQAKVEPKVEAKVEPKVEPKVEAKVEPKVEAKDLPPVQPKEIKPVPEPRPEEIEILTAIKEWSTAWSNKDTNAYLASYHSEFKTPGGQARSAWEADRKAKVTAPKFIKVNFRDPSLRFQSNGEVWVFFVQEYASDRVRDNIRKILVMKLDGQKWKIMQEMKDG